MPATGRNHNKTHRTEFNKRTGRWICGCGWKSEPIGTRRSGKGKARAVPQPNEESPPIDQYASVANRVHNCAPIVTYCVECEYESEADFDVCPRCGSGGRAVWVLRKA